MQDRPGQILNHQEAAAFPRPALEHDAAPEFRLKDHGLSPVTGDPNAIMLAAAHRLAALPERFYQAQGRGPGFDWLGFVRACAQAVKDINAGRHTKPLADLSGYGRGVQGPPLAEVMRLFSLWGLERAAVPEVRPGAVLLFDGPYVTAAILTMGSMAPGTDPSRVGIAHVLDGAAPAQFPIGKLRANLVRAYAWPVNGGGE